MPLCESVSLVRSRRPDSGATLAIALLSSHRLVRPASPVSGVRSTTALSRTSRRSRFSRPDSGPRFAISLRSRSRNVNSVNPASGARSEMLLLPKLSDVNRLNPASGERSAMRSLCSPRRVSRTANSRPVRSTTCEFEASSRVSVSISELVIASPGFLPNARSMASRRFGSGISTGTAPSAVGVGFMGTPLPGKGVSAATGASPGAAAWPDVAMTGIHPTTAQTSSRAPTDVWRPVPRVGPAFAARLRRGRPNRNLVTARRTGETASSQMPSVAPTTAAAIAPDSSGSRASMTIDPRGAVSGPGAV